MKSLRFENTPTISLQYDSYLYHKSVIQEFVFMEEDANNDKPKVVMTGDIKAADDAKWYEKVKVWFQNFFRKIGNWIQNHFRNLVENFTKNFAAHINYVKKNEKLNEEIKEALGNKFKPNVKNWPLYRVPLAEIEQQKKIADIIAPYLDDNAEKAKGLPEPTPLNIKKQFYPDAVANLIQESYIMEADDDDKAKPKTDSQKYLWNYFLYGKPNPSDAETKTDVLTDKVWQDTIDNILNCQKAIDIGVKTMADDLKKAVDEVKQKADAVEWNAGANEKFANDPEYAGTGSANKARSDASNMRAQVEKLHILAATLGSIANEYGIGYANAMQNAFFKTSYSLYKDIITEYKNTKSTFANESYVEYYDEDSYEIIDNDDLIETEWETYDELEDFFFYGSVNGFSSEVTNESLTFEEIDELFLEAAKVTVGDTGKKVSIFKRIIEFCKKSLNRIIAAFKRFFAKIFKPKQTDFERMNETIKKNEKLNNEILKALQNGSFNPKIENWPDYELNYPAIDGLAANIENYSLLVSAQLLPDYETIRTIRKRLYPTKWLKCIYTEDELIKEEYEDDMNDMARQLGNVICEDDNELSADTNAVISHVFENGDPTSKAEAGNKGPIGPKKYKPIFICFKSGIGSINRHVTGKDLIKALHNPDLKDDVISDLKWGFIWGTVGKFTHTIINHAGISLDLSLKNVFSYSVHGAKTEDGQGFVIENWHKRSYSKIIIFALYIPIDSWDKVQKYINHHKNNVKSSKYAMSEITNRLFYHKPKDVRNDDLTWVCSTFTNAVLHVAGCNDIPISKSPGLGHLLHNIQNDLSGKYFCVYMGLDTDFDPTKVAQSLYDYIPNPYFTGLSDTDRENEIIGSALSKSQMSNIGKQLKNYILFGDMDKEKYLEKLTPDAWKKLIDMFSPDSDCAKFKKSIKMFEQIISSTCAYLRKDITTNENLVKQLIELQDQVSPDNDAVRFDRCKYQLMHLKLTLQCVMETSNIFDKQVSQIFEKGFLETQYVLYRDTISVYNTYYKTKRVKESYVETTINNIDDLMTFDTPQYC